MTYRTAEIPMTLSDFQGYSLISTFSNGIFLTVVQQLTRFQLILHSASRGPSEITELLVSLHSV